MVVFQTRPLPKIADSKNRGSKNGAGSWFNVAHNTESGTGQNPDGRKVGKPGRSFQSAAVDELLNQRPSESQKGLGGGWFDKPYKERGDITGRFNSKSAARKEASAQIAKIPFPLAQHIAKVFKLEEKRAALSNP
jgi:hypothetical protein